MVRLFFDRVRDNVSRRLLSVCWATLNPVWIIDPDQEEVTVYRFDQDPAEPVKKPRQPGALSSPLMPGIRIALPDIFRRG